MGETLRPNPPKIWLHIPAIEALGKGSADAKARLPAVLSKFRRDQVFTSNFPLLMLSSLLAFVSVTPSLSNGCEEEIRMYLGQHASLLTGQSDHHVEAIGNRETARLRLGGRKM